MIRALLSNGFDSTVSRTIDKVDIFNDGSGKALYRFDGNTNDESGNYSGTENTTIAYGGGSFERCASKIGANGNITLPTITGLSPITMSMSMWVKFSTYNTANNGAHIQISNGTNIFTLCFGTSWIADIIPMYGSGLGYHTPNTLVARNTDTWMHICLVYSGSTTALSYYINGVLIPCTYSASGGVSSVAGFRLGSWINGTYAPNNNVAIDQLRVFNRALTLAEVSTLYNEIAPTSILSNTNPFEDGSLKALYQFDGNANDATGVYNGTADGTVTYSAGKFGNAKVCDKTALRRIQSTYTLGVKSSISFWVRRDTADADQAVFASTNAFFFTVNYTDQWIGNSPIRFAPSDATVMCPVIGRWYHIVIIDTGTAILGYRDGIKVPNSAGYTTLSGFVFNYIGGYATTSANLVGLLDQVRIFNRALTPMEVACLYNETTPLEEPMHSLLDPFKDNSGVALYRLDGNSLDESGNYNGTNTAITYGAGKLTRSAIFNGSSSYITGAGIGVVSKSSNASVSVWFKTSLSSANQAIYSEGGDTSYPGFSIVQYGTNITVWWTYGTGTGTGMTISSWNNVAIVIPDTWNHLVITKQSKTFNMYLNGIYKGSFTITNTSDTLVGYQMTIGHLYGYSYYWNGSIDQLRIFNKALTQAEVTALYTEI